MLFQLFSKLVNPIYSKNLVVETTHQMIQTLDQLQQLSKIKQTFIPSLLASTINFTQKLMSSKHFLYHFPHHFHATKSQIFFNTKKKNFY